MFEYVRGEGEARADLRAGQIDYYAVSRDGRAEPAAQLQDAVDVHMVSTKCASGMAFGFVALLLFLLRCGGPLGSRRLGLHRQAHCQEARTLHRRHLDGEATTLDSLGYIDHHTGHNHQAITITSRPSACSILSTTPVEAAKALEGLDHPHAVLGQWDQARAAWQQALNLYRELGRDTDAERVQRQLGDLEQSGTAQPNLGPARIPRSHVVAHGPSRGQDR